MDISSIRNSVIDIARIAGVAILNVYENVDFEIENKADDSPLTLADRKANRVICDGLEKISFHIPIVSEENRQIPYNIRKNYERYWLVDPLDGTKEFIKKNGEFTVNIALIENGKPVFGVVYAPVLDEMYWANKGNGAYIFEDHTEKRLECAAFDLKDTGLRVVCSRSHLNDATKAYVQQFKEAKFVSKGSSLKFLMIAKGEAELYPRLAPTMEWDTAAAQIILEEAGGTLHQFGKNIPVAYNKENLLNPHFVAMGRIIPTI